MLQDDEQRANLGEILQPAEQRTKWIGKLFYEYLKPIPPGATVCAIGVGQNCMELLQLRKFSGSQAHIFAVDVLPPDNTGILILGHTNTEFIQDDLQAPIAIAQRIGRIPDLVIMRHPRIIEEVDKQTGKVLKYNEWWLTALLNWARLVLQKQGQILITFMAQEERDLMAVYLDQQDIRHTKHINPNTPPNIQVRYGVKTAGPDRFVIKIPN